MTKGYVTDADIAAEIKEAAPGNSWADVKAAAEAVCRRLRSRDDDKTVLAFLDVIMRSDLNFARADHPSDRERADYLVKRIVVVFGRYCRDEISLKEATTTLTGETLEALAAVRAERDEEWAKAARELLEAEYRLGDMMSNKNHDLYRAALDNYTTKRNALAALVEGVKG